MVRIFFNQKPKEFTAQHPGKVFAVIGPFENHYDRSDLREALRKVVVEHNRKRSSGPLSLSERS